MEKMTRVTVFIGALAFGLGLAFAAAQALELPQSQWRDATIVQHVQAKKKPGCMSCIAKCNACGDGAGCINACNRNGNPMVASDSACGGRFRGCK